MNTEMSVGQMVYLEFPF